VPSTSRETKERHVEKVIRIVHGAGPRGYGARSCCRVRKAGPDRCSAPPAAADGSDSVTHHTIALGATTLAYTARAGTVTPLDSDSKPSVRMLYVAYTLGGVDPNHRPVTSCYRISSRSNHEQAGSATGD
jgi:hypothetical protein